jgi:hypothetical protein
VLIEALFLTAETLIAVLVPDGGVTTPAAFVLTSIEPEKGEVPDDVTTATL